MKRSSPTRITGRREKGAKGVRGEGRVFQRGRRWWIAFYGFLPNGERGESRESAGPTEAAARQFLRRRIREVANHLDGVRRFQGPNQERITVNELLDNLTADYRQRQIKSLAKTIGPRGNGGHLKPIRDYFGPLRAIKVTSDRIRTYITLRQESGLANASVNRETEILGRAFRLAVDEGRLAHAPKIPALPERNARTGFFELAEFEAILRELPDDLKDFALFTYLTGWRRSEVAGLRWENVDRATGEIRLFDSKNGEGRVLPMDSELVTLIERRWSLRGWEGWRDEGNLSAFVFHRNGVPRFNCNRAWRKACVRAGYPDKLLHDCRRTVVRDLIRGGVPETVAMALTGHKTRSVFARYNITTREDKLNALQVRRNYLQDRGARTNVAPFGGIEVGQKHGQFDQNPLKG
jgi:integrase